jgi:hypothetical protein
MSEFKFNKDQAARDKLLGIPPDAKYGGGIEHFEGLPAPVLRKLIEEQFANPEDCQNCSPTIQEFLDFMEEHPGFTAHGYAVELRRSDYRISIEGLRGKNIKREDADDFVQAFRFADDFEFEAGNCYCWYD